MKTYAWFNAQHRAHSAVHMAVIDGRLMRPALLPCTDCAKRASEYDHRDYGKPLEVEPVCHSCNIRRGSAVYTVAA